jgi:Uma2 family endonuclease
MGSQGTTALTLDDFLALREAAPPGVRYEAVGGRAVMMSGPTPAHQFAVFRLGVRIHAAAPPGLHVLTAPLDWVLWQVPSLTLRQPDLVVVNDSQLEGARLLTAPLIVVEVLSPTTRAADLRDKRAEYARAGARHYWIVDLDKPSIEALGLDPTTGDYRPAAFAEGDQPLAVTTPFPVTVTPSELLV